jgi:tetratricopeptide (TPR) repeat protein
MGSFKKVMAVLFCLAMVSGCGVPRKKVVSPRSSPAFDSQSTMSSRDESVTRREGRAAQDDMAEKQDSAEQYPGKGDFGQKNDTLGVQGPLPSMGYVNDRIFEYGRKLERWKEMDAQSAGLELTQEDSQILVNCFVDLQNVLDGYNQLRSDMLRLDTSSSSSLIIGAKEVMDLQKSDISFLESRCGKLFAPEGDELVDWASREEDADLPQLETLIKRYMTSKEYEEVVKIWRQIPEQQRDRVNLRTRIHYGNALMYQHQEKKAAQVYQEIVDEMSASDRQKTDLLSLRKRLADLYTASENYEAAEEQYNNISRDYKNLGSIEEWATLQLNILERSGGQGEELTKFSKLLKNFLGFVPERDGYTIVWQADEFLQEYPYSPVASNVDLIKEEADRNADKWFEEFFKEVNTLAAEKKHLDAIKKLESIPTDLISEKQKQRVKNKNEDLVLAEAVERETRKVEKMQELQERWNEGMLKVDEGDYEAAIGIFQTLLQTEYFAKARDKIDEITLLAAKSARRDAADLYIRYTKTSDAEMKKKLLVESRKLLKGILEKYPEVGINEKVQDNIERVEQEMNALDPNLLEETKAAETQQAGQASDRLSEDASDFTFPGDTDAPAAGAFEESNLGE